ncbi:Abscisic acid G-protein coupled receptor-domain-containing protein [Mycena galopus ATCC 62051]|nr:Abscisic acid G-protein coupled receptor-domain-containing protein [Mycena galopus ATCC 62051]
MSCAVVTCVVSMVSTSMSGEIVTETGILLLLRAAIFFACRKYLLRSLYSDLQDLSDAETTSNLTMDMRAPLPSPITERAKPRRNSKTESVYGTLSSDIFAGCFSESCMLFVLLMLQGVDVFSPSTRLFNWRLSMFLLLTCILVLVPFLITLLLTVGPDPAPRPRPLLPRLLLATLSVLFYIGALSLLVPLPPALAATRPDRTTTALGRLLVLGTLILGVLAGFGAVSSSWAFIPTKRPATTPTEQDVASAEYALASIRDDLERKKDEAARRAAAQQTDGTWLSRVMPSFRGDENLQELKGLEALSYQMTLNLADLRRRRAATKFSATLRGRLINVGGRVFALYCLFRYVTCIVNIFFPLALSPGRDCGEGGEDELCTPSSNPSTTSTDAVTALLAALLQKVSPEISLDALARATRHVSLLLVGVIILSSVRRVLRGVARPNILSSALTKSTAEDALVLPLPALRVTSRNLGASLMLLLLAQLMVRVFSLYSPPLLLDLVYAIYLLSTIVQLRASFPPPSSPSLSSPPPASPSPPFPTSPPSASGASIGEEGAGAGGDPVTNLLSTIPAFEPFGALFDWAFLLCATGSLVVRWAAERVNGPKEY